MIEVEEWRTIPGYEGSHEASNLGRIRSLDRLVFISGNRWGGTHWRPSRGRILDPHVLKTGYSHTNISGKTEYVHRLVLLAFAGPPPFDGAVCAHWDGDRSNNRVENLRWATQKENMSDLERHGTKWDRRGESGSAAKLTWEQVRRVRERTDIPAKQFAEELGVCKHSIHSIRAGRTWQEGAR